MLSLLALSGCVTEKEKPGLRYQGRPVGGDSSRGPVMPSGPIAAPVLNASFNSSVEVEVLPLGGIAYDGQVLPLVSPNGRLIASQEGVAPTWPTLLAGPGAEVPKATRIAVYDLTSNPVRAVALPTPLPKGLLLGRSADDEGFLVEAPQPDGSRWIGRVDWASGSLRWLVRDDRVNWGAVLTPGGSLAYSARDVTSGEGALVLRATDGSQTTRSGAEASHLYPVLSPEPGILCSLSSTARGLELLAWSTASEATGPERLGSIVARAVISPRGDAALAYQIIAPSPSPPPQRSDGAWHGERPVVYHPRFGRMAEFDRDAGGMVLLPERSIAAARSIGAGAGGWFVTTPEGLLFSADGSRSDAGESGRKIPSVKVLAGPFVPRQTTNPDRPLILLGPSRDPRRLQVLALRFTAPGDSSQDSAD